MFPLCFRILSFHHRDVWFILLHTLPAVSEHRHGGQLGHDWLDQLVHPLGEAGELAGLGADHLDKLRHLATTDGAELQQRLHAAPDLLLIRLTLEESKIEFRTEPIIFEEFSEGFILPGRIAIWPSQAQSRRHRKPGIRGNG